MSNIPSGLKYVSSHEWLRLEDNSEITVGITDYAQELLGDIVFIELPNIGVKFSAGEAVGVIESVKAASDIYIPISAKIVSVNDDLLTNPNLINTSSYDQGWIFRIKPDDINDYDNLLNAHQYKETLS